MPTQVQTLTEQTLIEKIHTLPPEKVSEVVDFVEFLAQRQEEASDRQLTKAATQLSAGAFAKVWDNPEDAVYENGALSTAAPEQLPFWATATPQAWIRAFEEWVEGHPRRQPLPDSAFERAGFYEGRL